ncbi:hypothetical protein GEMRC1_000200 [Eukaryota sp. GEM-RC1]
MNTKPVNLIIDTDAGVDDSQALICALRLTHNYNLLAITTCDGNCGLENVNRNVARVSLACNTTHIPIVSGCHEPLVKVIPKHNALYVHGKDGLGDVNWDTELNGSFSNSKLPHPISTPAAIYLIEQAREHAGNLDIIAIGPVTNLALALKLDPTFSSNVRRVFLMSGSLTDTGNVTKLAEFNAFSDPEALFEVCEGFSDIQLVTWETTLSHTVSWEFYDKLCNLGTPMSEFFKLISKKTAEFVSKELKVGWTLPDPLTMIVALFPHVIEESEQVSVTVCLSGTERGRTIKGKVGKAVELLWNEEGEESDKGGKMNVCYVKKMNLGLIESVLEESLR